VRKYIAILIPDFLKLVLKKIYYLLIDIIDGLKGRDSMVPPRSMIFVGDGDFEEIGEEFKNYFVDLAGLQSADQVLDVGCGIGRMAIPLTDYLSHGEYWGFDIVKKGIDWCQNRISLKFNNFHFQHSDIYNGNYNPSGKIQARNFQFPFDDKFFNFVLLTSVFTHMLPTDTEHYMDEISRVLKIGGKCLITFFILNDESENLIRRGNSTHDFRHRIEGCLTTNKNNPEVALAYREKFIRNLFEKHGLIIELVHYGSWCGRNNFLTYQDLIIATKR